MTSPHRAQELADDLRTQGVRAVALAFVDNAGICRVKCVPIDRFADVARSGVGLSPVFSMATVLDTFPTSPAIDGPAGDLRLIPDVSATVVMASMPGWAWSSVDQYTQDGEVWPACPRSFAGRMTDLLARQGLRMEASFEHEFFVGDRPRPLAFDQEGGESEPSPAHVGPGYGSIPLTDHLELGLQLIDALQRQGVEVMQFHPEYSDGQFEVSVAHQPAAVAADTSVMVRQTIRAVVRRLGLHASFAPVVVPGLVGNGTHLHLSLCDAATGANLSAGGDGPAGMQPQAEAFYAGMLRELPALTAIACPSVASYERLVPHHWAGAFAAWGVENREAAMRFVPGMTGTERSAANMELKIVDGAANPYLVIGSVIAAGLAGVEVGAKLPAGIQVDPGSLEQHEQTRAGVARLPSNLEVAVDRFEGSATLREAMGEVLFDAFRLARRAEVEAFEGMEPADLARAHRWRY